MELNLRSNTLASNANSYDIGNQPQAQLMPHPRQQHAEGEPVPPLGNAADLSASPSAKNLQAYHSIRAGETGLNRGMFDHLSQAAKLDAIEAALRNYETLNAKEKTEVIAAAVQFINSVKIDIKNYEKVTLFIGQTGAGKSTLINYLAGAEIKGKCDEESKTILLDIPNMLQDIRVGHGATSCTFAPMPYEDTATGLVYFDCPGFMDSRGVLHEIIAAKLIQDVIWHAKQVNFVITVKEDCLSDRGYIRVLQNAIDALETYAPDFEASKNSMLLVVTQGVNNKNFGEPGDEEDDIKYFKAKVAGRNGILNESSQNLSGYQKAFLQFIHDSGRFTYSFKADIKKNIPVSVLERERIIQKIKGLEAISHQGISGIKISRDAELRSVEFAQHVQAHLQSLDTSVVKIASRSISDFYSKAVKELEGLFHPEDTQELTKKLLAFKDALSELTKKTYLGAESFFTDLQALLDNHKVVMEESMLQNIQNILAEVQSYESVQSLFRKICPATMDISNTPLGLDGELLDLYNNLENLLQICMHLQEYQPIKPGLPYMQRLEDETENSCQIDLYLTHARDHGQIGNFEAAEKNYEDALKYTESVEHYKTYAACLKEIYLNLSCAPLKDAAKERVYKEKTARALYYLGELYAKQTAWKEAQNYYKASCKVAIYEVPLKALVDVARQIKETIDIADALENLAEFYTEKEEIALAIDKLEEAFKVLPSLKLLQKLETLYVKDYGANSQLKVNKTAILHFELQISQEPKNTELYRDYGWFLKSIGRHNEARALKKRMDAMLQAVQYELFQTLQQTQQTLQQTQQTLQQTFIKKKVKDKAKIVDLNKTIDSQAEVINHLKAKLQAQVEVITVLAAKVKTNHSKNSKDIDDLQKTFGTFEKEKFPAQVKTLELTITDLNQKLSEKVEANASSNEEGMMQNHRGINSLNNRIAFLERQAVYLDCSSRPDIQDADLISLLHQNPYIKLLNLQGCQNITAAGLAPLKGSPWLTSLNLSYCNVTDAGLGHFSGLTQLTELNLYGCKQLTDAGLRHFAGLTQLTSLSLACCPQITDAGLRSLARLTGLTALSLYGCPQVTDAGLGHLAGLTRLTSLSLACCQITDAGLFRLSGLTQLTALSLNGCTQFTDAGLQCLARLTRLTSLSLESCNQITDRSLGHLSGLTQLTSLNLYYCQKITSNAKENLKRRMPGLKIKEL